jgi:LysM repeat protein
MRRFRSSLLALALSAAVVAPAILIEPALAQGRLVEREVVRYQVRSGDTLSSIARAAGISLRELQALNPDVDARFLRVGQTIYLPASAAPVARVSAELETYRGRIDDAVTISGSGFRPGERVRVLIGDGPYRLNPDVTLRANRRGEVEASLDLPRWARPGSTVHFGLESRDRDARVVVSRPYEVAGRRPAPQPDRGRIEMSGTLTRQGAECPVMRGDDGRTYSLAGPLRGFRPGDRIFVEGRIAEMSYCQQGTTIEVRRVSETD